MSGHGASRSVAAWRLETGRAEPQTSHPWSAAERAVLRAAARLFATGPVGVRGYLTDHGPGRTHHIEAGADPMASAPDGEPLVLLHGGAGGGANWFAVLRQLGRTRRVLAPDLPGFGLSNPMPAGRPLGRLAASRVASWLRELGVRRFALMGTSFGGLVAAHLAARRDVRVTRLILVDSAGLGRTVHPLLRLAASAFLRPALRASNRPAIRTILGTLMVHRSDAMPPERRDALVDYLYACGRAGTDRVVADALPHFLSWNGQRDRADLYVVPNLDCPVLAVAGEKDAIFPVRHVRRLARRLPHVEAAVVPDAGHSPMWEAPAALVDCITPFLAGPDPARADPGLRVEPIDREPTDRDKTDSTSGSPRAESPATER